MPCEEEKTGCEHRRSLRLALDFLAYHPVSGERMSLVNGLRDQLKNNPGDRYWKRNCRGG